MTIAGRAALPTAGGLLTDGHDVAVKNLRVAVDRALTSLPKVDSFVLLAAGDEGLVHDASAATVSQGGQPDVRKELHHDEQLLAALASRGQIPRVRNDHLEGALAALALLVTTVQPEACVQPVTVPRAAGREALEAVAAGIVGAARATERRVAIVAAGDLAVADAEDVAGAEDFNAAVLAALRANDAAALGALGPATAEQYHAEGWAPLTVLLSAVADRGPFAHLEHHEVGGIDRLVAHEAAPA